MINNKLLAQINNPALSNLSGETGPSFLGKLIRLLISIGLIAGVLIFMFMLITGAISYITSGGDKNAVAAAREKITNALIGLVILFAFFAVVTLVGTFFGIDLLQINLDEIKLDSI